MFIQFSKLYVLMFGCVELLMFAVLEWLPASDAMRSWNSFRSISWCLQPSRKRTWLRWFGSNANRSSYNHDNQ